MMDRVGNKIAAPEIAMIKVVAPRMCLNVVDRAIQAHGGGGVTTDFGLGKAYAGARTLRIVDGPDEVHNRAVARLEFKKYREELTKAGCTGAGVLQEKNPLLGDTINVRTLAMAEELGLNIMTLCSTCQGVLSQANLKVKKDKEY